VSTLVLAGEVDPVLTTDVIAHLDVQLSSARALLAIVLKQGAAIRDRDVQAVVALTGMLQAEIQRRAMLEDQRAQLLERSGARLGVTPGAVSLTLLEALMDPESALAARERSAELRGLLEEIQREHRVNRVLMHQELAFLDHLLRLADDSCDTGYDAAGERPAPSPSLAGARRRVFDTRA